LAKQDDTARRDLRELLTMLRDQLSMPPLSPSFVVVLKAILNMLGEQDLDKRLAIRERISAYLAETWGE
jgi:hypothetical protein